MIDHTLIWRRRWKVWVPALIFFLVSLAFLSTYRLVFAGQTILRTMRIEARTAEMDEIRERRLQAEALLEKARSNREGMQRFYSKWLADEDVRLTRVIAEVRDLARRAGVEPTVITYPKERLKDRGMVKRSLAFSVEGSYMALRRFVNFLEVSDLFLVLEEVGLSESGDSGFGLRISLKISTYFVEDDDEALREAVS